MLVSRLGLLTTALCTLGVPRLCQYGRCVTRDRMMNEIASASLPVRTATISKVLCEASTPQMAQRARTMLPDARQRQSLVSPVMSSSSQNSERKWDAVFFALVPVVSRSKAADSWQQ